MTNPPCHYRACPENPGTILNYAGFQCIVGGNWDVCPGVCGKCAVGDFIAFGEDEAVESSKFPYPFIPSLREGNDFNLEGLRPSNTDPATIR
jgi:hypothetical protein